MEHDGDILKDAGENAGTSRGREEEVGGELSEMAEVEKGMEDMVLEEGRLEDTTLNLEHTHSYYTLNVSTGLSFLHVSVT